jgi:galacturan 1,4-alpha-galacturonidase
VDIVENIYVGNITMSNASDGARIKTWPAHGVMSGVGEGGGGSGRVSNITYEGMKLSKVDWAVQITQCYGLKDRVECKAAPSKVTIKDVFISGFTGTTSGRNGDRIASLACSSESSCSNIQLKDISVTSPKGGNLVRCSNANPIGIKCA